MRCEEPTRERKPVGRDASRGAGGANGSRSAGPAAPMSGGLGVEEVGGAKVDALLSCLLQECLLMLGRDRAAGAPARRRVGPAMDAADMDAEPIGDHPVAAALLDYVGCRIEHGP